MASHLSLSVMSMSTPAGYFHASCAARPELLARYGLVAAGGAPPPRHGKALARAAPARLVAKKGGRHLAVVVAAAANAPPPGEGDDDDLPSDDCEAAVAAFRRQLEVFRLSQRPVAFVYTPSDPRVKVASSSSTLCTQIVDFLLEKEPVHRHVLEEVIVVGQALQILDAQANEGYVKVDALVNAIQGLKLLGDTFFKGGDMPLTASAQVPEVPLSADDVDKDLLFKELINLLFAFNSDLYWQVVEKYGGGGFSM